jgi:hypothetical protein
MMMRSLLKSRSRAMQTALYTPVPSKNFSGGGPKKPNMPADQTDFDLVIVGKYNIFFGKS